MKEKLPKLSREQVMDYYRLRHAMVFGGMLNQDCLRSICRMNQCDPKAIGEHFLEVLPGIKSNIYKDPGYKSSKKPKALANSQVREYFELFNKRESGELITPEHVCSICSEMGYDAESIGRYFLEKYWRYQYKLTSL